MFNSGFFGLRYFEAILTGDATEKVLGLMDYSFVQDDIDGDLDVLKIPHHGSKYSLHKAFYNKQTGEMCNFCRER
jgi:beta-lactamase superfamily II metal-dependent hydrolase